VVTPEYEQAVVEYRKQHSTHGPIRIALALAPQDPQANRGTVLLILQKHQLTKEKKAARQSWQIPVRRHRLQMDVQQLPAVAGNQGFEYKISLIHLATRWKYSEIHRDYSSQTIAQVYRRALDRLPPFLLPSPITQ
jgi:hypothetical protein